PQSLAASFAALPGVSSWVTPTSTSRPGSPMAPITRPSTVTLARLTRCTTARTTALPSRRPGTDAGNAVWLTLSSRPLAAGSYAGSVWPARRDGPRRLGAARHRLRTDNHQKHHHVRRPPRREETSTSSH